jgi:hypothetical protein
MRGPVQNSDTRELVATPKDDLDQRLGICIGLGLTAEAAAEFCDVSRATYYNRTAKDPATFSRWRDFAAKLREKAIAPAIKKAEAVATNEERMSSVFLRALTLSEKRLERAEQLGEEISDEELRAIHKDFTKWAAPWAASQAPKRIQVNGEVVHTHQLLDETAIRLTAFLQKYEPTGLLPPAEVVEAEVVSQ